MLLRNPPCPSALPRDATLLLQFFLQCRPFSVFLVWFLSFVLCFCCTLFQPFCCCLCFVPSARFGLSVFLILWIIQLYLIKARLLSSPVLPHMCCLHLGPHLIWQSVTFLVPISQTVKCKLDWLIFQTKAAVQFHSLPHHLFPLWTLVVPCIPKGPEVNHGQDGNISW